MIPRGVGVDAIRMGITLLPKSAMEEGLREMVLREADNDLR